MARRIPRGVRVVKEDPARAADAKRDAGGGKPPTSADEPVGTPPKGVTDPAELDRQAPPGAVELFGQDGADDGDGISSRGSHAVGGTAGGDGTQTGDVATFHGQAGGAASPADPAPELVDPRTPPDVGAGPAGWTDAARSEVHDLDRTPAAPETAGGGVVDGQSMAEWADAVEFLEQTGRHPDAQHYTEPEINNAVAEESERELFGLDPDDPRTPGEVFNETYDSEVIEPYRVLAKDWGYDPETVDEISQPPHGSWDRGTEPSAEFQQLIREVAHRELSGEEYPAQSENRDNQGNQGGSGSGDGGAATETETVQPVRTGQSGLAPGMVQPVDDTVVPDDPVHDQMRAEQLASLTATRPRVGPGDVDPADHDDNTGGGGAVNRRDLLDDPHGEAVTGGGGPVRGPGNTFGNIDYGPDSLNDPGSGPSQQHDIPEPDGEPTGAPLSFGSGAEPRPEPGMVGSALDDEPGYVEQVINADLPGAGQEPVTGQTLEAVISYGDGSDDGDAGGDLHLAPAEDDAAVDSGDTWEAD